VAQIGTGRVGRPTAYSIMCSGLASELTVCDIKPDLAGAFAEELRHTAASLRLDVEIESCGNSEEISGAEVILVSAGMARTPGAKMTRRDLAAKNAEIVKKVSEATASRNPGARYIVITNPVDVMAMICKKFSKADFVVSAGTNLESLRLRSKLARTLQVPVSKVQGWAGGEHGEAALILWSTARAYGTPVEEYSNSKGIEFDKDEIESYMKTVSKFVVDNIGGTEYGPAASFRDITRAIINNTDEVLSVAIPLSFEGVPEPTFVGVPIRLGWEVGPILMEFINEEEKKGLAEAAKVIYRNYKEALATIS